VCESVIVYNGEDKKSKEYEGSVMKMTRKDTIIKK
jgi:hypothetical protein